jgi:muramidase (phage lysozyme)
MHAEDEEEAHGGHPDQDQRFQDFNKTFQSILGMDDKQYTQFKRDMHQPGADWHDKIDTSRVDFKRADDFTRNPPKGLLDLISRHESGGDYNVVYGGKHVNLTSMSINEVLKWQKDYVHSGSASSAAGRYQFLSGTLEGLKKEMHLSGNEKFDEAMQDKLATRLLERRGLNDFMSGRISQDQFQKNLAMEWASLPKDNSGRSYYAGDGLNKALTSPRVVQNLLAEVKAGSTSPTGTQFNGAASGTALASNTPERTPSVSGPAPSPNRNT